MIKEGWAEVDSVIYSGYWAFTKIGASVDFTPPNRPGFVCRWVSTHGTYTRFTFRPIPKG